MKTTDLREALLWEMHRAIARATDDAVAALQGHAFRPAYPPGVEVSTAETVAIRNLSSSPDVRAALAKIVADAAAQPLFQLFALIDGVADPKNWSGPWFGATIALREDDQDQAMWHDDFFETFGPYAESRAPDV
jgi:hypothetical protein